MREEQHGAGLPVLEDDELDRTCLDRPFEIDRVTLSPAVVNPLAPPGLSFFEVGTPPVVRGPVTLNALGLEPRISRLPSLVREVERIVRLEVGSPGLPPLLGLLPLSTVLQLLLGNPLVHQEELQAVLP